MFYDIVLYKSPISLVSHHHHPTVLMSATGDCQFSSIMYLAYVAVDLLVLFNGRHVCNIELLAYIHMAHEQVVMWLLIWFMEVLLH